MHRPACFGPNCGRLCNERLGGTGRPSAATGRWPETAARRPRVRRDGQEVSLPTVRAFTAADPLDALDLVALLIDGVHVGGHCIVVALGLDKTGAKHPLGLWAGATENTTVCQDLLANLQSRGLRTDRSLLVILDGAPALHAAMTQTFGPAALVQRCQVHKRRNVLKYLPESQRPWVKAILTRGAAPAIAGHHERHREPSQPDATCEAQREALARGRDGSTLGRRRGAEAAQGFRRVQGCKDMPGW